MFKRERGQVLNLPLLGFLLILVLWRPSSALAAAADTDVGNGHFYTQANGDGSANGFLISDDGGIPFWTWFQRYGGVNALGYPNTGRFTLDGFTVQGTQRVLLQWHPDTQTMAFVNIFDRLHDAGLDPVLQATYQIPPQVDNSANEKGINAGSPQGFQQLAALREGWLNFPDPSFKNRYFSDQFHIDHDGLPTSQLTDFGPFITIRLQRKAFQLWKVDGPAGIKAGTLVEPLGSDIAKKVNFYPSSATVPQPAPNAAPGTAPGPTPLGGAFGYGFQGEYVSGQEAPAFAVVKGAGFGWIKQQVRWEHMQQGPGGAIDYGELDTMVSQANAAGLKVLFSVVAAPTWAAVPYGHFPQRPADLASFMSSMAGHFKGKVQAYEVWNEENYGVEVGSGQINPGQYVEALKATYPAIKAADPAAIVVSGAPTPTGVNNDDAMDDLTYLQGMFAYQGGVVKDYFDALGAHNEPYANGPTETVANHTQPSYSNHRSFFFRDGAEAYRALMVASGAGNKPIWETEIGYDANPLAPADKIGWAVSEQTQATDLVGLFQYARTNYPWMGAIFVWNLNFPVVRSQSNEVWGFGVVRPDYSPRPAYTALAAMAKT